MENKIEHLRFVINRYDEQLSNVNTKGSFLLAFNTFLIGGGITSYKDFISVLSLSSCYLCWFNFVVVLLLIVSLIAMWYTIRSVYPFLSSGNIIEDPAKKYISLIYFDSITTHYKDGEQYFEAIKKQNEEKVLEDLSRQAYIIGEGICRKFRNLNVALFFVYTELILISILILIAVIDKI